MARTPSARTWSVTGLCGQQGRNVRGARLADARRRSSLRAFTLTELMVVVVISGILATVGFASLRKQSNAAWHAEGLSMVQSIRAAEERWRAEHMMYLNVSSADQWYPADPRKTPGTVSPFYYQPGDGTHIDQDKWLDLRPSVSGPVRFGYLVNAGHAGENMTLASSPGPAVTWPTPPDNWFVIQAIGDTNGNGGCIYYRASSLSGDVFTQDND